MVAQAPRGALAYEARIVLGRALQARGKSQRAFEVLDQLAVDYNEDLVQGPDELMWLGVSLQLTDYVKNASQIFGEVLQAQPDAVEARLLWAELFILKYNHQDSDALYKEVLQRDEDNTRAQLGLAVIDVESDRDYTKAKGRLEAILKAQPDNVPAHNLMARIDLENERIEDAIKRLKTRSLKVAPNDPEGITLLAAAHYLADDTRAWKATEKRALALNPTFAGFYTEVAVHAARVHRYREALGLAEKALQLDPEHWRAYAAVGTGYSRVGDDAKASEYLDKAFDGDPFDVRVYNLLSFFYDKVIKQFEWIETPTPIRVRVHKSERPMLERYVPDLLTEAWKTLKKKYAFSPEPPVHVEIFHDPQLFSIRSIGLPQLGAHGICFGHVVTARSPSAGDFNWGDVLWHELAHVFHIQLSDSRVPRWFTEGLAVWESEQARPEWRREMDQDVLDYRNMGRLRGVEDFNLSFTTAESQQDILVAYYHAYLVVDFIAAEFGFPKMRKMLAAWGKRLTTKQVFTKTLGVSLEDFDKRFAKWLDKRLAPLDKGFSVNIAAAQSQGEAHLAAAKKAGASPRDKALGAAAALVRGKVEQAEKWVAEALKADPEQPEALLMRSSLARSNKEDAAAKADLEKLLALGKDGPEIRQPLAEIARRAGDKAGAVAHLEAALKMNPHNGRLYYVILGLLDELGREADAYAWRKKTLAVDEMNVELPIKLLEGAEKYGATKDEILRWGELVNHIAPFVARGHVAFAKELARLGMTARARFEAESALLVEPDNAEAKALLGK